MEDLIKALQIALKYETDPYRLSHPTNCSHDTLWLCVDEKKFSPEDIVEMERLGFFVAEEGGFQSYRFGSC